MGLNTLDFCKVLNLSPFLYITQNTEIISCKKLLSVKRTIPLR